ncbi:MAG: YCF48-related protein [Ignavibacteria bacterium]|nr:YCF48-related protein [Ignavibacteria bacterium]
MKKKFLIFILLLDLTYLASICECQWIEQNSGTTELLRDVQFVNLFTGWAVGDNGTIIKTTNGGNNWINVSNPATGKPLMSVHPVNPNVVYVVGWFETIIKTTNGGDNWIIIKNGPWGQGNNYETAYFLDVNTGWITGCCGIILKTINGGDSLSVYNFPLGELLRDIYFINAQTGIATGSSLGTYKTTNGGNEWHLLPTQFGYLISEFYKLSVINNRFCWLAGRDRRIYRSNDFGEQWDTIYSLPYVLPSGYILCSEFADSLIGWAGGEYNRLYKTTNGGFNWVQENTGSGGWMWKSIYCFNDSIVWGVGGGGKILHTTTGGQTLINISGNEEIVPGKFELGQNFPNPFNPTTNISYDLPKDGFVTLKIYDATGREIKTLVNGFINAGKYIIGFDGKSLASGIYYYKLISGDFVQTKRMVLIK